MKKTSKNQILTLEENWKRKLEGIENKKKKLQKEISNKQAENEALEQRALILKSNVEQWLGIINLLGEKKDNKEAGKFNEIALKRKLLDMLEQQTEEIHFLREELDRYRAKTFPSFAHVNQKYEHPDEN